MISKFARFLVAFAVLAVAIAPAAWAQGIGGSISGRVLDQQNAAVAGASVRILNKATNQSRIVSTDAEGNYEARELPPGLYDVIVEQAGFKPVKLADVRLSVATTAKLQQAVLEPVPLEATVEVKAVSAEVGLTDTTSPTLSTSFSDKQIRELPILSRDLNNLALLAPGVFSVRAFSFASTLVPFAANGSRGRDNNFIIDSVDNNEPLFGGAATQFTNTDLFAEYRILTNQYKAEYGRNSGSVVNIITERGGNNWHGSAFWYGQHDNFNAQNSVERIAQIEGNTLFYENQLGLTMGGPIKKDKTWFFASYQWDRARHDLSPVFPLVATIPQPAGLTALQPFSGQLTVRQMLANPTVAGLPGQTTPCGTAASGLPLNNPCTIGQAAVFRRSPPATAATNCFVFPLPAGCSLTAVPFGSYLVPRAGLFDVRDHQGSFRLDHQLTSRDDIYARYLFDDVETPRTVGAFPAEIAFLDLGLMPEYRVIFRQRTQNLGLFWTHAWPTALHELRLSGTRIATRSGAFGVDENTRENVPAFTVVDFFALSPGTGGTPAANASFLAAFPSAGVNFTLGRDSRPTKIASNLFQLQDNLSLSTGKHSIKLGANFVVTDSNIRQASGDLGQYIYATNQGFGGFDAFVNNRPIAAFRRFTNFGGRGGDVLPLREFAQFYFLQDDIQLRPNFTLSLGIRYENYGQVINRLAEINPSFGSPVRTDNNNFAPRIGIAWSPFDRFVFRGGYGFFYNPTAFIIPLLAWQSGPISPLVTVNNPVNSFPFLPVSSSTVTSQFSDCTFGTPGGSATPQSCSTQDGISKNLVSPYVQNYSLSMQWQFYRDGLFEVAYVASKGTSLFQRVDRNPVRGWLLNTTGACAGAGFGGQCITENTRPTVTRGGITEVTNGAHSTYNALQLIGTKRISRRYDIAVTAAYTWSHMIDNASEIFGPGVRLLNIFTGSGASEVEAITPFAQDYRNTTSAERGNSSFDRRHRLAVSYLWNLPGPEAGVAKHVLGGWQWNGFVTIQSGQPFTPLNGRTGGACTDSFGDGLPTNDRPDIGSAGAAENSVALINNALCIDPRDFSSFSAATLAAIRATNQIGGAGGPDYIDAAGNPTGASANRFVQVGLNRVGNAGRNILQGPRLTNFDMAVLKNFPWGERWNLQFRAEVYNVFNTRNPGNPIGNVFSTTAQPVPGIAFVPVTVTPARVIGTIPENAIDAQDQVTGAGQFLSRRFMNTSSRHFQFALKLQF